MKLHFSLAALILFISVLALVTADEPKEVTLEKLETAVRPVPVKKLCKRCFRFRGPETKDKIRRKGCPASHGICGCKKTTKSGRVVRGVRCSCKPRRRRAPRPSKKPSKPITSKAPSPLPSPDISVTCDEVARSGGKGTTVVNVNLGKPSGSFTISYQMFSIPDALDITYEGNNIFSTGGLVSGSDTQTVSYSGSQSSITVTLSAPRDGTLWNFMVSCPSS